MKRFKLPGSKKKRPQGATVIMRSFSLECMKKEISQGLEKLAPFLSKRQWGRNHLLQVRWSYYISKRSKRRKSISEEHDALITGGSQNTYGGLHGSSAPDVVVMLNPSFL